MAPGDGTYGIKGIPISDDVVFKTVNIPYVTGMPLRYEISAFAESKDKEVRKQWTLFVLGLESFKNKPVEEKLSYFQIAGIHGYPETEWDSAPPPRHAPEGERPGDNPFGGYCNHNGLNFPTWHRPYMLLFEQVLYENMNQVIDHWQAEHGLPTADVDVWRAAAKKWRLPYWDWARRQEYTEDFAYPEILTQGNVRIYVPKEVQKFYPPKGLYPNPLWGFDNPEQDENGDPLPFGKMPEDKKKWNIPDNPVKHDDKEMGKWNPWSQTSGISRYGIYLTKDQKKFRGLEGVNNPWSANARLADMENQWYTIDKVVGETSDIRWNPGTLADAVNRMFSPDYNKNWGQFASTKWLKEGREDKYSGYLSLEYIHNNVHNITGGGSFATGVGHMSDVPVAAFDPIFWLHHCQIDRLLAIWQCLYPERWWDTKEPGDGNVRNDEPTDPLQPFHNEHGGDPANDVWTAEKCRDWTLLHYQYDDLQELARKLLLPDGKLDETAYKYELRAYINKIYPSTPHLIWSIKKKSGIEVPKGLMPSSSGYVADGKKRWVDYIVNVIYDRFALEGRSYSIEFYLGGKENERETHFTRKNYVGHVYNFSGGVRESVDSCQNCKTQAENNVLSCAQVPLTIPLMHHALDKDPDHPIHDYQDIDGYLDYHLRWRFVGQGGTLEDPEKFPKTRITVFRGVGTFGSLEQDSNAEAEEENELSVAGFTDMPAPELLPAFSYEGYKPIAQATAGNGKPWGLKSGSPQTGNYNQ